MRSSGGRGGGAVRQETLREHNLSLIARTVMTAPTPPSRADVATATGLTRATVSRLVTELIDGGLVAEDAPLTAGAAGRPAIPLRPATGTVGALGLEVNIDYLAARVLDLSGRVLAEATRERDLRGSDPGPVLSELGTLGIEIADTATAGGIRLAGTGLALPGLLRDDVLLLAPNLAWTAVTPAALLGGPIPGGRLHLGNEARFAAGAELAAGSATDSFLYLSGSVGIGAAIVHGGEIFAGEHGWSGELGHVCVDPAGDTCRCGATGCLETYAGSAALLRRAGLPEGARPPDLVDALAAADPGALAAVHSAARALGTAVGAFINLVDVSEVVLGNSFAPLTEYLRPELERELTVRVLASRWAPPQVRASVAGDRPALTGAARAALAGVTEDPSAWLSRAR
ncbi:ROK family transcriptional regulator [Occultella glacieicola]|uniref:ROK family transcriptional regulator n=1 Tax=Occultella glacieicola TaxID=2518684 RepID=A0ABY2E149_9MICO|nr:ROK family transcriptional regulator [Occultella glacieicola]TDE91670.1 ROK family transcriptional regulator [Occultella glacieicola]